MFNKIVKTGAKALNKSKKNTKTLSKKEQTQRGMGTSSSYRIGSATRGKRTAGQNKELQASKKRLKMLKEKYKYSPTFDIAEEIERINNKIQDIRKRTGLRKGGGSVGSHNRLY